MASPIRGPKVVWRIYVPEELATRYEVILYDRRRGKPEYGARSQLVVELLQRNLELIEKEPEDERTNASRNDP